MIDNHPDTLLLNKVAYRCDYDTLEDLLKLRYPIPAEGRPLHYFMIPVDPKTFVKNSNHRSKVEDKRNMCLKLILENYTLKREFGVFVHEEEIKLMDQLIAKETKVKKIVKHFKKYFINYCLTEHFSDSMTFYDLVIKVFNKRSLQLLVKDDQFLKDYDRSYVSKIRRWYDQFLLHQAMYLKILNAYKRRELMEIVENISQLTVVIPLPYEIILINIEYLDNDNFKNFVNSFYKSSVCK
ncbi:Protein of unknown function [Cotesia congregata]|uniref:Uncharacterized protein n=1 Tax=Cotesia congregata TaxID=51543 RepID=A0A8J2HAS3_COTCN|nr:Protein of unknown function [Cotesia congregata]